MFLLFGCFVFNHQNQTKHPSFTNRLFILKQKAGERISTQGSPPKVTRTPSPHIQRRGEGRDLLWEVGTTTLDLCQGSVILDLLLVHIYMFYTITYWSLAGSHKLNEHYMGN